MDKAVIKELLELIANYHIKVDKVCNNARTQEFTFISLERNKVEVEREGNRELWDSDLGEVEPAANP